VERCLGRMFALRAALGCLFLTMVALSGALAGCSQTFVPQTTTLTDEEAFTDTTASDVHAFELDITLNTDNDLLQEWTRACEYLGLDPAAGQPFAINVDFSDAGAVQSLFVQGVTGSGGEFRLIWPDYQGTVAVPDHTFVEITPATAPQGMIPMTVTVQRFLRSLAAVGPSSMFAKLPAAGVRGKYGVNIMDMPTYRENAKTSPTNAAYAWTGSAFQEVDPLDGKYIDSDGYISVSAYSMIYSTTTSAEPPPDVFMYMTTSPFVSSGDAVFFLPLVQ
jgi:hypothetical protein